MIRETRLQARAGKLDGTLAIHPCAIKIAPHDTGPPQVTGELAFCPGKLDQAMPPRDWALRLQGQSTALDRRPFGHLAILHTDPGGMSMGHRLRPLLGESGG